MLAFENVNSYIFEPNAGIAQLVERNLAKVDVAGSNPVSRSVPFAGQKGLSVIAPTILYKTLPLLSGPAAPNPTRWRGYFLFRPQGQGEVSTVRLVVSVNGAVPKW